MVRERIRANGPMPYADVVQAALYDPDHGFYASGGRAGRRGDFLTSPEVGPLFGHLVARAIDAEWDRLGQPDEFMFVDYGAGPGTLARAVFASPPRCVDRLRYVAVERSAIQRADHPPGVISLEELTSEHFGAGLTGIIFANELLDNFVFTPIRWSGSEATFAKVQLGSDDQLVEEFVSQPDRDTTHLLEQRSVVDQTQAGMWVKQMTTEVLAAGRVIVIDYARLDTSEVEVRTYAEHGRQGDPLLALGTKDITVDVDLEALQRFVGPATSVSPQHVWLRQHGLDDFVDEGREIWEREAAVGGLEALRAKSRIREADSLCDPSGLGGFFVSEWVL